MVQEAFVAAWLALPTLAEPAAFPGWLRGIVRHHAFRVLRRKQIARGARWPRPKRCRTTSRRPDHILEQRRQAAAALAAISELPDRAARARDAVLRPRMLASGYRHLPRAVGGDRQQSPARGPLASETEDVDHGDDTLHAHALPDDFANRIGRLIETRGDIVEALFDPARVPDLMTELTVSDEARKHGVTVQVMQRPGGGVVRGLAASPIEPLPKGATVLSSRRRSRAPSIGCSSTAWCRCLPRPPRRRGKPDEVVETGIKVIDVMCPIRAGGSVAHRRRERHRAPRW